VGIDISVGAGLSRMPVRMRERRRMLPEHEGCGMKITYDPQQNVAYIRFREKRAEVETLRINDDLNIDLSPDGTVYGIELLNANEPTGLLA